MLLKQTPLQKLGNFAAKKYFTQRKYILRYEARRATKKERCENVFFFSFENVIFAVPAEQGYHAGGERLRREEAAAPAHRRAAGPAVRRPARAGAAPRLGCK